MFANGPNEKNRSRRPKKTKAKKAQQDPCEETSMQQFNRKPSACRFSEKISFVCVHGFMQLQPLKKGAAITQSIVMSSYQLHPAISTWRTGTHHLRYKQKQQVLKHMAISRLAQHTRKESSAKQGVCATARERFKDRN